MFDETVSFLPVWEAPGVDVIMGGASTQPFTPYGSPNIIFDITKLETTNELQ
jgi:hypothetical protein